MKNKNGLLNLFHINQYFSPCIIVSVNFYIIYDIIIELYKTCAYVQKNTIYDHHFL